ncbi:MAG: T9SS type A sorting domain-containing protein [Bacteroidota bacterium]
MSLLRGDHFSAQLPQPSLQALAIPDEHEMPYSKARVIRIYPNPAQHSLQIQNLANTEVAGTIELVDQLGRTVLYKTYHNTNQMELDVSTFATGIYFLKVSDANSTSTIRRVLISN